MGRRLNSRYIFKAENQLIIYQIVKNNIILILKIKHVNFIFMKQFVMKKFIKL